VNVSAIIVTRGDVDLAPVLDSLPDDWEQIVWDNSGGISVLDPDFPGGFAHDAVRDLSVYGRYAAIEYAAHDLIYVQDDDVIVSNPQEIVDTWKWERVMADTPHLRSDPNILVANMPQEFRHAGYTDSCLVGFGACFHRDLPRKAFGRFDPPSQRVTSDMFERTCDVVFTTLAPARGLVDVPITHREFASDPARMWKQPGHVAERARMLELARKVRDA